MPGGRKARSETKTQQPPVRADGLQLEENRKFQERWWSAERITWVGFGFIVIIAAAGLLGGGGPLADAEHRFATAKLEYPRIARWLATDEMRVLFAEDASQHTITFDGFSEHFVIEAIAPTPARTVTTDLGHSLAFEFEEGATEPVVFSIRASDPGVASFRVSVGADAPASVSSLILP